MVLWYLTVKNDEQSWFNHQKRWFITNFMGYCHGDIFHEMDTMTSGVSANWVLHTNDSCIGNIMTNKWIKWATLFSYSNACSFIAFRILFLFPCKWQLSPRLYIWVCPRLSTPVHLVENLKRWDIQVFLIFGRPLATRWTGWVKQKLEDERLSLTLTHKDKLYRLI